MALFFGVCFFLYFQKLSAGKGFCQNMLSTGLLLVVSTNCNKSENEKFRQA